jgi:hypothetical protein
METNIAERLLRETNDFAGSEPLVDVEGMSSPRVCNLLNRLVAGMDPGEHYLEVGTWKGRTLLSAAHGNTGRVCYACDKFRFWGRYTGWGYQVRSTLDANIARYREGSAEIRLFAMRSRELFARRLVPGPIGVYFYDGGHSYRATRHGIVAAAPLLSRRSVVLVDDWNDAPIRKATFDGIAEAGLKVLWARYLEGTAGQDGFWDGVGAFYLERP